MNEPFTAMVEHYTRSFGEVTFAGRPSAGDLLAFTEETPEGGVSVSYWRVASLTWHLQGGVMTAYRVFVNPEQLPPPAM